MGRINDETLYPLDAIPRIDDMVIGTDKDTGNKKTKNYSLISIANLVGQVLGIPSNYTGLISVESVEQSGDQVTVINALWRVNGVQYTSSGVFTINPATTNYYRTDIIVGGVENNLYVIEGVEDMNNPVQPPLPINTVLVSVVNVYSDQVSPEVPPLDDFKRKSEEAQHQFYEEGPISELIWNSKNSYRWMGTSDTILSGMMTDISTEIYMYDGRNLTISNDGTGFLTLRHSGGVQIPFYLPDSVNIILRKGERATFKYSSASGFLELLNISSPQRIANYGLPLTVKTKGEGNESASLQENDICFGKCQMYDSDSMAFIEINVDSAIYNGGDNTDLDNYTLLSYQQL